MEMFSDSDKQAIQAAVKEAESRTAGEIVVVHALRSEDYAFPRACTSLGASMAAAWALLLLLPEVSPLVDLLLQVPFFFSSYWLLGQPRWLRLIAPGELRRTAVEQRAMRAFVEQGITETRARSGVLLFLSEAERQVVILADKGINDRVEKQEWRRDVDEITQAIRAGRAAQGVVVAVQRIGELLAQAFPIEPDDTNELADGVREVE